MRPNDAKNALLAEARAQFGVPAATSIGDVVRLMVGWGAEPIGSQRFIESLIDEYVDESLIVGAWTIWNPELFQAHATLDERALSLEDPDEIFDPYEYGADQVEWTIWGHEKDLLQRVFVVLERRADNPYLPGNFRVHGASQWLREVLWAATGVVPRDVGGESRFDSLFARAFAFEGRAPLTSLPLVAPPEYSDEEIIELLKVGLDDDEEPEHEDDHDSEQ